MGKTAAIVIFIGIALLMVGIFWYGRSQIIPTVGFEVRDNFGEKIDWIYASQGEADYDTMWELYRSARRNALKIGDPISNMMRYLGD